MHSKLDQKRHQPYCEYKLVEECHAIKKKVSFILIKRNTFEERIQRFNCTRSAGNNNSSMSGIRPLKKNFRITPFSFWILKNLPFSIF